MPLLLQGVGLGFGLLCVVAARELLIVLLINDWYDRNLLCYLTVNIITVSIIIVTSIIQYCIANDLC